ncbi:TIGR00269 family protein [Candidatus Micrarchaeota archaeon]|nr:TIGR00269 family protein [Candidatus Micrarchaeota archaeon]
MSACLKCGLPAAMRMEYTMQDLCGGCFTAQFERRVAKTNRDFSLLRRGDIVAVGVSGGKDSAAMLYCLDKMAKRIGGITLKPILIDEGIEGYRNVAALKAQELCSQLGYTLQTFSYKELFSASMDEVMARRDELAQEGKEGFTPRISCTYCGVFRKQALNKAALGVGANKLAVGHNADDTAQTFMMNLMRSEPARNGPMGSAGGEEEPQEGFARRVKPLVYNLEIECALFCKLKNLPFHLGGCPYAGESFRGYVKDFLNGAEKNYPGTKFNLLHSFLEIQKGLNGGKSQKSAIAASREIPMAQCTRCGEKHSGRSTGGLCKACEFLTELQFA